MSNRLKCSPNIPQIVHSGHSVFKQPCDNAVTPWLAKLLASPQAYAAIAERQGEAPGYLFAQEARREESVIQPALHHFILEHIAVAPRWQRQSIGTQLIEALFAAVAARQIPCIELDVWSFNAKAQ